MDRFILIALLVSGCATTDYHSRYLACESEKANMLQTCTELYVALEFLINKCEPVGGNIAW